jgi:hypothetical protein
LDGLEQIDETTDPKLAGALIDDASRKEAEYSKEMYETSLWKQRQSEGAQMIQKMRETYPAGHPMSERLRRIALGVALGDIDAKDAFQGIKAEEMGAVQVTLPNGAKAWMEPKDAGDLQDKMADNERLAAKDRTQAEAYKRRDELRALHEKEMRTFRGREVKLKEDKASEDKGAPSVSRGIRGATFGERQKMFDELVEEQNMDFEEAWAKSGEMVKEHIRAQLGELGGGTVQGKKEEGDPFLSSMDEADRKAFDALTPEEQARVRKELGGG